MTPASLNKSATNTFEKIVAHIPEAKQSAQIGEKGGAFMPVHVERLGTYDIGTQYSIAHYFEQNGDLCQDPEMIFIHLNNGAVVPCVFQQAIPPVYQESIVCFRDAGWKMKKAMQLDHARFANTWMKNIKEQQNL